MKQILVMIAGAMVFLAAVTSQAAMLKTAATVEGDRITLGDLFDGVDPERREIAVAQAPTPGRRAVFDAAWLSRVARQHGIDWLPVSPSERATVTRASNQIGIDRLRGVLAEAITARNGEGRVDVEFDDRTQDIHLPVGAPANLAAEIRSYDTHRGRFEATVIAGTGADQVRVPVSGRAVALFEAPVPNRRIRQGEVIGASDLTWIEVKVGTIADGVIRDDEQLIGQAARRTLSPNAPIRASDLRQPTLVAKGALVSMVLEGPGIQLTAQGRALQDGTRGDVIRILNTTSNRTIEATVSGPNKVSVARPGAVAQY